jgi:hypothetical protein
MKPLLILLLLLCFTGPLAAQQKPWEKCTPAVIPQATLDVGKGVQRLKYPLQKAEEVNPEGQGDRFTTSPESVRHLILDPTDSTTTERVYAYDKGKGCGCQYSGKNLAAVKLPVTFTYPDDPEPRQRDLEIHFRPGPTPVITKIILSGTEQFLDLQTDRKVSVQIVHTFLK